jgi:hypothetical protein
LVAIKEAGMRRIPALVSLVAAAVVSSGCLTASTIVRVSPAGSGTLEQTVMIDKAALGPLMGMLGGEGTTKKTGGGTFDEMFSEAEAERMAARMGEGVKVVSRRTITEADREGGIVLFSFEDITKLKVQATPSQKGEGGGGPDKLTFSRDADGLATLKIMMPEPTPEEVDKTKDQVAEKTGEVSPEQLEMVKTLMQGMRVAMAVEVEGTLVRTSSPFVEGNRVTVFDFDFGQLVNDPEGLKLMASQPPTGPMSFDEMTRLMKQVKGIKYSGPELTIEFK